MKTFIFLLLFGSFSLFGQNQQELIFTKPFQINIQRQYDMSNIKDTLIFLNKNEVMKNSIQLIVSDSIRKNLPGKIISEYTMIAYNKATMNNKFFLTHGSIETKEDYNEFFYGGIEYSKYVNLYSNPLNIDFSEIFDALQLYHFIQIKMPNGEKETLTFTVIRLVLN